MKKILTTFMAACFSLVFLATPAFAKCPEGTIPISVLDGGEVVTGSEGERCSKEKEQGSGISNIINLVLDIMTTGIAIIAVISITVIGIQYLTAGPDVGKTIKAKQRISEIIIGLAAYVLIYALIKWLMPGSGV